MVTVLITTYNYGGFIGRAIESALSQDLPDAEIEVLVVDDGSTDETAEVVERRFGGRVRYIRKQRGGQASAINLGVRLAAGDIVCLLDADDYFMPGKLRRVAAAFDADDSLGLVYDEFDMVLGDGKSMGRHLPEPTWTGVRLPLACVPGQLTWLIRLGHPWTCITSAMSLRRSILRELPIPEETFLHSPDLFLGLVAPFITSVAILSPPGTAYVYHGGNVGLFRSSAVNRELFARQMALIRGYLAERVGVECVTYLGHSLYGRQFGSGLGIADWFHQAWHEAGVIARARVDASIKWRSLARLATAILLPGPLYGLVAGFYRRGRRLARGYARRSNLH